MATIDSGAPLLRQRGRRDHEPRGVWDPLLDRAPVVAAGAIGREPRAMNITFDRSAAACAKPATGYTYARREPEKTALFQVLQQHLLTFAQEWTDKSDGRTLPSFVTDELHDFLGCGILARGFAQLLCKTCHQRYAVAWSCKGRGFCPSCGGRRMNAGALTLVDHVLPEVPIRQFVLTVPFSLRFPLAFDGKLLGQVLRIFIDTVASNYRRRMADRGIADGESGAVTVIQRANSDLRLSPHFHVLQLDGVYAPGRDGGSPIFHPAPELTQEDVLAIVEHTSKRILRFLKRRGVISPRCGNLRPRRHQPIRGRCRNGSRFDPTPSVEPAQAQVEGVVVESLADLRANKLTCLLSRARIPTRP